MKIWIKSILVVLLMGVLLFALLYSIYVILNSFKVFF